MSFEPFTSLTSKTVVLEEENIDTDQIIPARFLTTVSRQGLGKQAFYDWRYDENGEPIEAAILNKVNPETHKVLVGGSNFGCGSSREHAPWALYDFGFRVVISSDVADIFKSNSLKNGLLPVEVDKKTHQNLLASADSEVTVDLVSQTVKLANGWQSVFEIEPFARQCLLDGVDPLGHLLNQMDHIKAYEAQRA